MLYELMVWIRLSVLATSCLLGLDARQVDDEMIFVSSVCIKLYFSCFCDSFMLNFDVDIGLGILMLWNGCI